MEAGGCGNRAPPILIRGDEGSPVEVSPLAAVAEDLVPKPLCCVSNINIPTLPSWKFVKFAIRYHDQRSLYLRLKDLTLDPILVWEIAFSGVACFTLPIIGPSTPVDGKIGVLPMIHELKSNKCYMSTFTPFLLSVARFFKLAIYLCLAPSLYTSLRTRAQTTRDVYVIRG